jgi:hypothetical protein
MPDVFGRLSRFIAGPLITLAVHDPLPTNDPLPPTNGQGA